jgi:hypothetical protein
MDSRKSTVTRLVTGREREVMTMQDASGVKRTAKECEIIKSAVPKGEETERRRDGEIL